MRLDLGQQFEGIDGKTMADPSSGEPYTLKSVLIQALTQAPCQENEKMKYYDLYRKLRKCGLPGLAQFKVEEVVTLKAAALKVCTTVVCGQVHEMLETEYVDPSQQSTEGTVS
jgi:hypothetical protein